tara:strand:+ start:299 stop:475 length:177 start_codon:yes stop_codon:yes gene_type:complete
MKVTAQKRVTLVIELEALEADDLCKLLDRVLNLASIKGKHRSTAENLLVATQKEARNL